MSTRHTSCTTSTVVETIEAHTATRTMRANSECEERIPLRGVKRGMSMM